MSNIAKASQPNPWHGLSPRFAVSEEIAVVVETPAGSRNKYVLDAARGLFKLDRALHSSRQYPGDHGFIPRTLVESGNPLHVLLLIKEPTYPGCVIAARPIGLFRMREGRDPETTIIAVPMRDPDSQDCFDIDDIPRPWLREVESFFARDLATADDVAPSREWDTRECAVRAIRQAIDRYRLTYLSYLETTSP